jgi:hypothetical protein
VEDAVSDEQVSQNALHDMVLLTPEEIQICVQCEKMLKEKRINALILKMKDYSPQLIFKLNMQSKPLAEFCLRDTPLSRAWGTALKKLHHSGAESIRSVDGKVAYPTVNLYMALAFTVDANNPLFLSHACKLGLFTALKHHCEDLQKAMHESPEANEELQEMVLSLGDELLSLGNCYWTPGYLVAARIWLDMGNHFTNLSNSDPDYANLAKVFYEASAESIFSARLLEKLPQSQDIIEGVCPEPLKCFGFTNWDDLLADTLQHIDKDEYEIIRDQVHKRLRDQLAASGLVKQRS